MMGFLRGVPRSLKNDLPDESRDHVMVRMTSVAFELDQTLPPTSLRAHSPTPSRCLFSYVCAVYPIMNDELTISLPNSVMNHLAPTQPTLPDIESDRQHDFKGFHRRLAFLRMFVSNVVVDLVA